MFCLFLFSQNCGTGDDASLVSKDGVELAGKAEVVPSYFAMPKLLSSVLTNQSKPHQPITLAICLDR